ncbi:MAG: superoxide dismutase family protein [Clostridiales bacterium]|nr:superoxide dismutase family protein [Clostridiales bacterium]
MTQCNQKSVAKAIVKGSEEFPDIRGEVLFCQKKNGVLITANVSGLPRNGSGFYGFHIHEGENCGGDTFSNTLGHYNPKGRPHPTHSGDLPPLLSCSGNAYMQVISDRFRVRDIIGRTVIIHKNTDDFRTQPSGDAGEKIACGEIWEV